MRALDFWKTIAMDQANLLERLITLLNTHGIQYCVIGWQAINAYVEPLVSLDMDLVVALEQLEQVESLLAKDFSLKRFSHSLNVSIPDSDLRVQIRTDPRYADFIRHAEQREALGLILPIANLEDILRGKVWAVQDTDRRGSKRQKDLADIARLLEAYPDLRDQVPQEILSRLV
jgi:hypothetical protein